MVVLMARLLSFAIFLPSLYPDQDDFRRGVIFRPLKFCYVFNIARCIADYICQVARKLEWHYNLQTDG